MPACHCLPIYSESLRQLTHSLDNTMNHSGKQRIAILLATAKKQSATKSYAAAEATILQLLRLAPDNPDYHNDLGIAFWEQGKFLEAENAFRQALRLEPQHLLAIVNLGNLLLDDGKPDASRSFLEAALRMNSRNAPALLGLGRLFLDERQFEQAQAYLAQATREDPSLILAWTELAKTLQKQKLPFAGISALRQGLAHNGPAPLLLKQLGNAVRNDAQGYEEAVALYQHCLLNDPENGAAYINLGSIALVFLDLAVAEKLTLRGLEFTPDDAVGRFNLGTIYLHQGKLEQAESQYHRALELDPDSEQARFNLSTLQLLKGDYRTGWKNYLSRRKTDAFLETGKQYAQPLWDGAPMPGKTLFIHHEQGFGDTLQCMRFLTAARERCGRLIVWPQAALKPLLETIPDLELVSSAPTEFDAHCPFFSLPQALDVTLDNLPWSVGYVSANAALAEKWQQRLDQYPAKANAKLRCGFVWAGNPVHINDWFRSMPLPWVKQLLALEGIQWVILQKERVDEDLASEFERHQCICPMDEVNSYSDTAAIVANLDLVITVDTSVAHLAGAMNKPTWILLPANPDWRWAIDFPDSSPWYPSVRLFRQTSLGDWSVPLDKLKTALAEEFGIPVSALPVITEDVGYRPMAYLEVPELDLAPKYISQIAKIPFWHHKIWLSEKFFTPGCAPINPKAYDFPESLSGKRVLDIGARDGYWTFEALRRGAREVVAIDDFSDRNAVPADLPYPQWENFDLCRKILGFSESVCRRITMSVYDISEETLGRFDYVLLYGVLHQLRHPLLALDKIASICDDTLLIESPILDDFSYYGGGLGKGYPDGQTLLEFYPGDELCGNPINRWSLTLQALALMAHSAGFIEVNGWKAEETPRRFTQCRGFVTASHKRLEYPPLSSPT